MSSVNSNNSQRQK